MKLTIIIGYNNEGQAVDGLVSPVGNDREAVRIALDWVAHIASPDVDGWRAFEYLNDWGPGREIVAIPSDFS